MGSTEAYLVYIFCACEESPPIEALSEMTLIIFMGDFSYSSLPTAGWILYLAGHL